MTKTYLSSSNCTKFVGLITGLLLLNTPSLAVQSSNESQQEQKAQLKSLEQATDELNTVIRQLKAAKLLNNTAMVVSAPKLSKSNYEAKFYPFTKEEAVVAIQYYFKNLDFIQSIGPARSIIGTNYYNQAPVNESERRKYETLLQSYNRLNFSKKNSVSVNEIRFFDGSLIKPTSLPSKNPRILPFNSKKRVTSLNARAEYSIPVTIKSLHINKQDKINPQGVTIQAMKNNRVIVTIPKEIYEQIALVEGNDNTNQAVRISYATANNNVSNIINFLIDFTEKAVQQISTNQITNQEQLKQYYQLYGPASQLSITNAINKYTVTYQFQGDINGITLYLIPEKELYRHSFTTGLLNWLGYFDGVTIAPDSRYLYGLMNEQGKWVVKPNYEDIIHLVDNYYLVKTTYHSKPNYKTYLLDKKNKTFKPQKFYFNSFLRIDRIDSKNIITHYLLEYQKLAKANNTQFEQYKIIVSHDNNELYNFNDKNLNTVTYFNLENSINSFGKANLRLVYDLHGKPMFIDQQGNKASFDVTQFNKISDFSNGFAAVCADNKGCGYINAKGELVIPLTYKWAGNFQGDSALVETVNDNYALITDKNQIIKRFNGDLSFYTAQLDSEHAEYTIAGVKYDEKGKPSKSEEFTTKQEIDHQVKFTWVFSN